MGRLEATGWTRSAMEDIFTRFDGRLLACREANGELSRALSDVCYANQGDRDRVLANHIV